MKRSWKMPSQALHMKLRDSTLEGTPLQKLDLDKDTRDTHENGSTSSSSRGSRTKKKPTKRAASIDLEPSSIERSEDYLAKVAEQVLVRGHK